MRPSHHAHRSGRLPSATTNQKAPACTTSFSCWASRSRPWPWPPPWPAVPCSGPGGEAVTHPLDQLSRSLPGSEVAQIVADAASAASADLCPWHPGATPEDEARRQLWLGTFAQWQECLALQKQMHPWRREITP